MTKEIALGLIHASCVAINQRAVLIIGESGQGKSTLALQLIGLGATLVSDDQVFLYQNDDDEMVYASAPKTIRAMIEARGIGILNAPVVENMPVTLVVDLDQAPASRLPEPAQIKLGTYLCDIVCGRDLSNLHYGVYHLMLHGRRY